MKKLLLLALLLCGISQAWAAEWTDGNGITWTFDVRSNQIVENIKPYSSVIGDVVIPEYVYYKFLGEEFLTALRVNSIAVEAFSGCTSLTSVIIPSTVTDIGAEAFSGCTSLTSVTILEGVPSIGAKAFSGCTSLTTVTIPSSVTTIYGEAFYGCTGLTSVIVPDIAAWCRIKFTGKYANPLYYAKNLYSVEGTRITDLVIPSGVTSIGSFAF